MSLKKLAEILGTTSGYLLGEENSDPKLTHLPNYLQSFIYDPESAHYIGEAYLMYMSNKVHADIAPLAEVAEGEIGND